MEELIGDVSSKIYTNNTAFETKLSELRSGIDSINEKLKEIATINETLSSVQTSVNTINGRDFVQKTQAIGIGTSNLKEYLPKDDGTYLVWVNASYRAKDGNEFYIRTDAMTIARPVFGCDGDAGRSSRGVFFGAVPVGKGRTITTSGSANWINLCGYCRI